MLANRWLKQAGTWYYLNPSGSMRTGWFKQHGVWYWLNPESGAMATGWAKATDGKWYYFNPIPDGTKGILYANRRTPDGWFVTADGNRYGKSR